MTTITVPRATWDALREALEKLHYEVINSGVNNYALLVKHIAKAHDALTAANAVSEEALITVESSLRFRLECEQQKSADLLDEVRELKGKLFKARQPQAQGEASEVAETLAQFGKDGTKDWPEWMKAAAHTATASFPVRSKEIRELDIRGVLAAKMTCWHRMTEADSDALVALFTAHPQATEPAWRPIETAPKDGAECLVYGKWEGEIYGVYDGLFVGVASFKYGRWGLTLGDCYSCNCEPTHWMPLPAAPEAKQ